MIAAADPHAVLLQRVAELRDIAAFGKLFEHFAPRIKAYLIKSGMSPGLAEDLSQEAMLILWRKAGQFDPARAPAAAWIFTIVRNLRTDAFRRAQAAADLPQPDAEVFDHIAQDDALAAQEAEDAVRAALQTLPPDQARIVTLTFFSEKPQTQIAAELGIPLGTVKSRLRLALERLRWAMGKRS